MTREEFIRLFNEYGFEIVGHERQGHYSFSIERVFEIFDKYGNDVDRYKYEYLEGLSKEEYEEWKKLIKSELDIGGVRCSGMNKNGERCKMLVGSDMTYESMKNQLAVMRQKHYCKKHKYQENELYQKAKEHIIKKGEKR